MVMLVGYVLLSLAAGLAQLTLVAALTRESALAKASAAVTVASGVSTFVLPAFW